MTYQTKRMSTALVNKSKKLKSPIDIDFPPNIYFKAKSRLNFSITFNIVYHKEKELTFNEHINYRTGTWVHEPPIIINHHRT